jgi:hypothetical protein
VLGAASFVSQGLGAAGGAAARATLATRAAATASATPWASTEGATAISSVQPKLVDDEHEQEGEHEVRGTAKPGGDAHQSALSDDEASHLGRREAWRRSTASSRARRSRGP